MAFPFKTNIRRDQGCLTKGILARSPENKAIEKKVTKTMNLSNL